MTSRQRPSEKRERDTAVATVIAIPGSGAASTYAAGLLASLDVACAARPGAADPSPAAAWARSGAMALTGGADEAPRPAPSAIASCADGAARALTALAEALTGRAAVSLDGAALLGERAALAEPVLSRDGTTAAGGSTRMLRCADGWLALNLARGEDLALLPAWLEREPAGREGWTFVGEEAKARSSEALVARGREMGLALAPVATSDEAEARPAWHRIAVRGPARPVAARPLVVDLSSLWAGPLCGQLLASCGARVIKVESIERPDGARRGERAFFDLLNGEKESIALAFREQRGRHLLSALLERADIVIEASRPRALAQLGIHAESLVKRHGLTWVSITGYGRRLPEAGWVAFGDDAAAAAGLVSTQADGRPCFCGDAIADPLTGLHAAVAALAGWWKGSGQLIDVSLVSVARHVRALPTTASGNRDTAALGPVRAARARAARRPAPALGADTARVLDELGITC